MIIKLLPALAAAVVVAACGGNGGSTAIAPVAIPTGTSTSASSSVTALQQDSGAKVSARNAETALETCYVDAQTYASCDLAKSLGSGAPALGSGPGHLQVKLSAQSYVITAHSRSGEAFMLSKGRDGALQRTCAGPDPASDCHGGSW
ncbi:MAG TPA: hypothetical protein VIX82_12060 [Solirubrobacteraceae bacterium]